MAGGTEFLIEIQQRMTGADVGSELDRVGASVKSAMDRYKELERAGVSASKGLEKVGQEMAKTRAAMKAAMDKGDDKGAAKGAEALQKLVAREKELQATATTTTAALKAQEKVVTALAGDFTKLAASEKAATDAAKVLPVDAAKAGDGMGKLGGPLGAVGQRGKDLIEGFRDLSGQLGTTGAAFAIAGVAAVAFAALIVAGVVSLAKYAIGLADVARNTLLTAEAFTGSASGGAALVQTYGQVSKATGVAGDRLHEISKELQKAGVAAKDFPAALKAIALQEQALGDTSGTAGLIDDLKTGKRAASSMATEMEKKFGGVVAKKMLGLGEQSETLQRNLAGTFGGLNIEPFLAGVAKLVGLLDSSTESGRALKVLFESVFQPLIDAIPFDKIERFFLTAIIGALKVGIAVKKMAKEFDFDSSGLDGWGSTAAGAASAAYELADALGIVNTVVFAAQAVWNGMKVGVFALTASLNAAKAAINTVSGAVTSAVDSLSDVGGKFTSIGSDIIDGIVRGIKDGASKVVSSITDVASSAVSAAKDALDIASPSKVFAGIGENVSAGMALGIEDGAPDVQRAADTMVEAPTAGGGTARAGTTVTIGSIVINGVERAEDIIPMLAEQLANLLDGVSIQMGAEPAPVAT